MLNKISLIRTNLDMKCFQKEKKEKKEKRKHRERDSSSEEDSPPSAKKSKLAEKEPEEEEPELSKEERDGAFSKFRISDSTIKKLNGKKL